jgi:hypothetical protein
LPWVNQQPINLLFHSTSKIVNHFKKSKYIKTASAELHNRNSADAVILKSQKEK